MYRSWSGLSTGRNSAGKCRQWNIIKRQSCASGNAASLDSWLGIGTRGRRKREREEIQNPKKGKNKKGKNKKVFFFFFPRAPPPESSQVITSLYLRLGRGGGTRKKKNWVLDFGFSLSLPLFLCLSVKPSGNCGQTETSLQIFGCIWYLRYDWRCSMV